MKFWHIPYKVVCCLLLGLFLYTDLSAMAASGNTSSVLFEEKQWTGDFDQLEEKRAIRILVPVSNPDFIIDGFKKYGIAPALIEEFQNYLNGEVVNQTFVRTIVIPVSRATILDRLVAGYGDIAVANLTITRERQNKVDFATPIVTGVSEIIVAAPGSPVLQSLKDLSGKKVHTRSFSSYHEHLLRLNRQLEQEGLAPVTIELVHDEVEDDSLLAITAEGLVSYMVLDHRKLELWQPIYPDVVAYPDLPLDTGGEIAWAVRKNSPKLLQIVGDFSRKKHNSPWDIEGLRKSTAKEFIHFNNFEEEDINKLKRLYSLFVEVGTEFSFSPFFLAALAFERSQFTAEKVGKYGELGVMQLPPFIEREVADGREQSVDPTFMNIRATAKYLASLRDKNFADLANDPFQQLFFVLAAYYNGPEKINEMRWITNEMGKNGDKWFNEVNVTVSRLIGRDTVRAVRTVALYLGSYQMAMDAGTLVLVENIQ